MFVSDSVHLSLCICVRMRVAVPGAFVSMCVWVYVCLGVSANEFAWCITESEAMCAWMCVYERVCQCLCSARGPAQWAGLAATGHFLYLDVWGIPLLVFHGDLNANLYISKYTQSPYLCLGKLNPHVNF